MVVIVNPFGAARRPLPIPRGLWVGNFDDQFVIPFVLQFNHDRIIWIVNIPEKPRLPS
jgi:hypothetical protein